MSRHWWGRKGVEGGPSGMIVAGAVRRGSRQSLGISQDDALVYLQAESLKTAALIR